MSRSFFVRVCMFTVSNALLMSSVCMSNVVCDMSSGSSRPILCDMSSGSS